MKPLSLFAATGIELEYMIVDRQTFDVKPLADELLKEVADDYSMEVERGAVAWSNELALHVIEMKTNGPAPALGGVAEQFQKNVTEMNAMLAPFDACLLPTAMHPWMNPLAEMRIWPHENTVIYNTFDRIFDCIGHGWANLQSTHINLPFADAAEFGRLHAAIRLILPILPAIAASSPFKDGVRNRCLDGRMDVYRHNAARLPSVSGVVIPERIFTPQAYKKELLAKIYADLAPFDPDGILAHEWVNARGAIARFDRHAIEIRVLDIQECPRADLAIVRAVVGVLRALVEGRLASFEAQCAWPEQDLAAILAHTIHAGDAALIGNTDYLNALGYEHGAATARQLWRHLADKVLSKLPNEECWHDDFTVILERGCLARRMLEACDGNFERPVLHGVYKHLAQCLTLGTLF